VVTLCVGLALSSLIDSSLMGVVCFAHLWKCGLCPQAPQISLLELTRSCGLDLDCLRISSLSLAHGAQFLVANVLTTLIGLPCQMMLQVVPSHWLVGEGLVSWNWVAKCLAWESDFSPSLTSFWTSSKCCCILFLELLLCVSYVHFPCVVALDFVDCCWISAHVVAATGTVSASSAIAG